MLPVKREKWVIDCIKATINWYLSASSTLIGTYLILLTSNPLSKKFGKRKMVLIDSIVMIIGTLVSVLSTKVIVICIGRLLMGMEFVF